MAIPKDLQQALLLVLSFFIAVTFRWFGIRRYKQEVFFLIGSSMVMLVCGRDVIYFFLMVGGACCLIKSSFINTPRVIFVFCFAARTLYEFAGQLGLPREETSLGKELLMLSMIRMIIVTYEIVEFRSGKKENESPSKCIFGVLSLEVEPSTFDLICYTTFPFGLFTGPICKYRTYSDMLKQRSYPPARWHICKSLMTFSLLFTLFALSMPFQNYFKSQSFSTDTLQTRLLHVYLVGFYNQYAYVCAWIFAKVVCVIVGLGGYPEESKPNIAQGPTEEFSSSAPEQDSGVDGQSEVEMNFTTVKSINTSGFWNPSFGQSILSWHMTVQWWLMHFVYRSNLIPRRMKFLRAALVFFVSALWHGVSPSYFWIIMQFPFVVAMDEACLYVQRSCIRGYWKNRLYLAFHLVFFKTFCHCYFISAFKLVLVSDQSVWNYFRLTYFAGPLVALVITLMCGGIRLFFPVGNFTPFIPGPSLK